MRKHRYSSQTLTALACSWRSRRHLKAGYLAGGRPTARQRLWRLPPGVVLLRHQFRRLRSGYQFVCEVAQMGLAGGECGLTAGIPGRH